MIKRILTCLIMLTLVFTSVNFTEVKASKKIKLNKTKVIVNIGVPLKLKVKNTKKKVKWKSSSNKIATVSKKGVVKGKKEGNCTITAKVGKKKLKCKIAVAYKVEKKITAKTMKKVAKKIKSKGTYDSSENCYNYTCKRTYNGYSYIGRLKYFPKTNHIRMDIIDNNVTGFIELRVGEKKYCKFSFSDNYENYMTGNIDKTKEVGDTSSIIIGKTNAPDYYYETAKSIVYPYIHNTIWLLDNALKDLKVNARSESFGFKWPESDYWE